MRRTLPILILLIITSFGCFCQTKKYSFTNEYSNWSRRTDYFNWKIYITGDSKFLASIRQIEYYLDPSFKNPKRIITRTSGGNNFTLCTNGWGEFTIRIKIIFTNVRTASINEVYRLDLHSPAKKKVNYRCP